MRPRRRIARWWHTVRHLRPIQVRYRLWYLLRRRLGPALFRAQLRHALRKEPGLAFSPCASAPWPLEPYPEALQRAAAVLRGVFCFANETRAFPGEPDWLAQTGPDRFWEYNLHYFAYAVDLAAAGHASGGPAYMDRGLFLMQSWIRGCPPGTAIAWDAGPVSHRILHWCRVLPFLHERCGGDPATLHEIRQSLYAQALYLEKNIEYHLLGNHVITNGAALAFAGAMLSGRAPARWRRKGVAILRRELRAQFLADGGHVERSPMYHALMLWDYLRVIELEQRMGETWFDEEDRGLLARAAAFLARIRHPDGELPLFNDCALGIAPPAPWLLKQARRLLGLPDDSMASPPGVAVFEHTGLLTHRTEHAFLILDAGEVGPAYNPAHAHGDSLSFEFSSGTQRVIADSGTCCYAPGPWRAYNESTRAHNTVVVDGTDQVDKWGPRRFRAGRRPHPRAVAWETTPGLVRFEGSHTGYGHLPGSPCHHRTILCVKEHFWIILDEITGSGEHTAESFLHFHPDIELCAEDRTLLARWESGLLRLAAFGDGQWEQIPVSESPPQGWYSPEFGVRIPRAVVVLRAAGALPFRFGWVLAPSARAISAALNVAGDSLMITCGIDGDRFVLHRDPDGPFRLAAE